MTVVGVAYFAAIFAFGLWGLPRAHRALSRKHVARHRPRKPAGRHRRESGLDARDREWTGALRAINAEIGNPPCNP